MSVTDHITESIADIEVLPDLILYFEFNPHVRVAYINPAISSLTLYDVNEFYRDPELFSKIIYPDDLPAIQSMLKNGNSSLVEFRLIRKDNIVVPVVGEFKGLFNPNGRLVFVSGVLRNEEMESMKSRRNGARSDSLKKLSRFTDELMFISSFGRNLGELSEGDCILQNLADAINQFYSEVDSVFLSQVQADGKTIECIYAKINGRVLDLQKVHNCITLNSAMQMASKAVEQKKPVIVHDSLPGPTYCADSIPLKVEDENAIQSAIFVPLVANTKVLGMIHLQSMQIDQFDEHDTYFLTALANITAANLQNSYISRELINTYDTTLEGWGKAVDFRDHETEGHSVRVANLTKRLATRLGLSGERVTYLWRGALLHDIGKLGIPDSILFKNGDLDREEWIEMRRHPLYAYDILKRIPFLKESLDIPYCHHEKWDGTGYPRGLKGVEIPLGARIFAVADVWDALLSDRPYRHAWDRERAIEYIRNNLGTHFDPVIGEEFLRMIEEDLPE